MTEFRQQRGTTPPGYTLIELLAVLLILGIVAAIALPLVEPATPVRAEAAAKEVAQAYRFAQNEAQRTGMNFVVLCDVPSNSISVNRVDMTTTPPQANLVTPVFHPLDKRPYKVSFSADGHYQGLSSQNVISNFQTENLYLKLCLAMMVRLSIS